MTSRKQELQAELKLLEEQERQNNNSEIMGHPYEIGKNYYIRTVTYAALGKLVYVGDKELKLSDASWVADQGRMSEALRDGVEKQANSEIEMFDQDVVIGRGAIVDATGYAHPLPAQNK
jgi:hypothetical protein